MNYNIIYKYKVGDTVQLKTEFDHSASCGLNALAGEIVTIIDCRYYGVPCYKFAKYESCGWFTEGTIKGKVNPFIVFVGSSREDLEPIASAPNKVTAIRIAKSVQSEYSYVEAIYMPEEYEDTNEVVYIHYEEVN